MKEPLMRTRFNRRSFLKSSAASWLAASKLRNSVAWASTGTDKRFKEWRSYGGGPRRGGYFPPPPNNPSQNPDLPRAPAHHTGGKTQPPPAANEITPPLPPGAV